MTLKGFNTEYLKMSHPEYELWKDPLTVYVVKRGTDVTDDAVVLSRWCNFHDLSANICSYDDVLTVQGRVLVISEDCYPSVQIPLAVVTDLDVCSEVVITPTREGSWRPSFAMLMKYDSPATGTPEELLIDQLGLGKIQYRNDIITDRSNPETEVEKINVDISRVHTLKTKYEVLCRILSKYWYDIDNLIFARYYSHLWMNTYQKLSCQSLNIDGRPSKEMMDGYDWVGRQSAFASHYEIVDVNGSDLNVAVKLMLNSKIPLGSTLTGYKFRVNEHPSRLYRHPLTLQGLVTVTPISSDHGYDTTITMVGYYYDLGYSSKPKDDYLASLDKYVNIKHPLVFYGDTDICNYVRERRDPLYTTVIEHKITEWQLVSDYPDLYESTSNSGQMAKSPRYALLTNCKTYAVMDVIRRNPHNSTTFVWHDPGFYRHGYMAAHLPIGTPMFSNMKIDPGKISMPSLTTIAQTTDQQYDDAAETLIAYVMAGDVQAWSKFHTECERLLRTKAQDSKIYTEQCLHTRIATLRPDLFKLEYSNYAPLNVNRFIGLETKNSETNESKNENSETNESKNEEK